MSNNGHKARYCRSKISVIWTLYADITAMLTNPITLKTLNRDSDFGSEDDYRTPPAHIRLWPFLGIFGHISHIRSFEVWVRAKEYFGAQYFQNLQFTKKKFSASISYFRRNFIFLENGQIRRNEKKLSNLTSIPAEICNAELTWRNFPALTR